jgi:hypothetical protein
MRAPPASDGAREEKRSLDAQHVFCELLPRREERSGRVRFGVGVGGRPARDRERRPRSRPLSHYKLSLCGAGEAALSRR